MIKQRTKSPDLNLNLVNDTQWTLSDQNPENFTLVLFYRGKHCPKCKEQLESLQEKLPEFTSRGVNVVTISSDTEAVAKETYEKWNIPDVPVAYGFSIDKARDWGLFISSGIKDEPDHFIEPGLFLIRPDQTLYCASIQTMPFARPKFDDLLGAIDFIVNKEYPARGEA